MCFFLFFFVCLFVFLFFVFFFAGGDCISFRMSKFKTRIHSKKLRFVRNALKKQDVHKYVISIHYYEKKHSFYNSGTICGGFFNPTP